MEIRPVEIQWHSGLPIFAKGSFLESVGDRYGWLGGFSRFGELRCILPYTIIKKSILRMARFRVETIPLSNGFGLEEERDFLNGTLRQLASLGADMIIPATTNAIFRTYPNCAHAAPYGSYIIDLSLSEETLWKNIDRIMRQNINSASKAGIAIREATPAEIPSAHRMIKDTFKRSKLSFMGLMSFRKFISGLGEYGKLIIADQGGVVQSCCVFAFSDYCAYAVYAGNAPHLFQGANKLLYWEAIRQFKAMGIRTFDFVGTRINPEKGSKQEALGSFKKRFGTTLKRGYIWKSPLRTLPFRLYNLAVRLRGQGDIVDAERHKLKDYDI